MDISNNLNNLNNLNDINHLNNSRVNISIDIMGGDFAEKTTLPAVLKALKTFDDIHFQLVGPQDLIDSYFTKHLSNKDRIHIIHTSEYIHMDDTIEVALRKKRQSSMRLAIEQVKSRAADVCVSSGNTGALMAVSRYVLKTMHMIERPAIATILPNQAQTGTIVLDLGANADCQASHLLQFAHMGQAMAMALFEKSQPLIGLLNIGEEVIKGNEIVKQAAELLWQAKAQNHLNFYGNVEGHDIFKGGIDVVVCDGFVGNVALKTAEGVAKMLSAQIKQQFTKNIFTKMAALLVSPILKNVKNSMDHRRYNGAMLLGLNGLVVKSHGGADDFAFFHAISYARKVAKQNLLQKIQDLIHLTKI